VLRIRLLSLGGKPNGFHGLPSSCAGNYRAAEKLPLPKALPGAGVFTRRFDGS